ncbi:DUF4278 domain-containing protein [Lusitaniella coriacea LEGE 07157]|uniref:DUF4278 domain-containing protein n=1 Tax=Lusitaniella coriacea LEGE 07157 TaxID=945747 RepID=A0A8J7JAL1_9CYAN|nr:DUF4278 domain-containing protein [Lusitaniella coriacea]MBE9116355.1 DUF4278 domain-containing protein [Lusitaniella coriacea LEGE 07157]
MRLTYRGTSYERKPLSLEVTEGEIGGTYRGQAWKHHYPRHIPQLKSKPNLVYRGAAYSKSYTPQAWPHIVCQIEPVRKVVATTKQRQAHPILDKVHQVHLENMRHNLEYRLKVAKTKGDGNLIHQLEDEFRQLALNP